MSLHSKRPLHLPNGHLAARAGVSQPCPHVPSQGQAPARHPLPPPAAGEGLTPSSCSPDAGSGIHICVIINLRVSGGDGGEVPLSPQLDPPHPAGGRLPSAAVRGEWGSSPGAAGSLPTDSQGDELGPRHENAAIFHPPCPRCASRGLGRPGGRWALGSRPKRVSLNRAEL